MHYNKQKPFARAGRWNFSVAEHQLTVSLRECVGASPPPTPVSVGINMPEGTIAVRTPDSDSPLWQQKVGEGFNPLLFFTRCAMTLLRSPPE